MSAPDYGGTGRSLAELEAMPQVEADARLADSIESLRNSLIYAQQCIREAESLLIERMEKRGATLADCGPLEARLERTRTYEYDLEGLAQLQAHLSIDDYETAVQIVRPEPFSRVSKVGLNKLLKLGGPVADIITASVKERPSPAKLVLLKKAAGL